MVLNKQELIGSLQNEIRILLHLAGKIDPTKLDYRPSAKQRSTLELLQYLSIMGPGLVRAIKAGAFDPAGWGDAVAKSKAMNFDQVLSAIEKQSSFYDEFIGQFTDAELRGDVNLFGRGNVSKGSTIVNMVLCGHAAYRTQLFIYLKACGRDELNTMNLWAGVDEAMPSM
jgi:hypothetical protein